MPMPMMEFEGTWEEIAAHAPELAGRKVRLVVLQPEQRPAMGDLAHADVETKLAVLRQIECRSRGMRPKPDARDYLREGRAGAMFGYEPAD
jgi:hypothetical protein